MRIALGADHAGVVLKEQLKQHLDRRGIQYEDFGTHTSESIDYPDVATVVAREVAAGRFDRGVLVCGTGIGMAIAANKVAGVRAAPVGDERSAALSREHNDANVLALGARVTSAELAIRLLDLFLDTPFAGGRHQRRLDKIALLDQGSR
ncbi:MAG: ribose 5-phosphate isomerase B [Acidobacteriota bacterium]|jgi:ribose 5-phosphate isomerase B|nr:MAG: ribose 5-phosphate isomerase B [Acidobacteriota bacterium]